MYGFENGSKQVIWKRSQYLHQWKQRQLQMIDFATIATAKQQTIDGWNASFQVNIKDIFRLTIYRAEHIHDHLMTKIKLQYPTRHTYMADKDRVAFGLFMTIIRNKCIAMQKTDKLEKAEINGNKLIHFGTESIIDRFVIYRKAGIIMKDWVKEEMVITSKRFVTYSKLGFGEQANEKGDWSVCIKDVNRIRTNFQFYKDFLIIHMRYQGGSCYFAIPIMGDQMEKLFRAASESHRYDD